MTSMLTSAVMFAGIFVAVAAPFLTPFRNWLRWLPWSLSGVLLFVCGTLSIPDVGEAPSCDPAIDAIHVDQVPRELQEERRTTSTLRA